MVVLRFRAERKLLDLFNLCEAVLWWFLAAVMAIAAIRYRPHRDLLFSASVLFIAFGFSDLVETWTGAWYRPWWLLVWKAATVVGLVVVYVLYRRRVVRKSR